MSDIRNWLSVTKLPTPSTTPPEEEIQFTPITAEENIIHTEQSTIFTVLYLPYVPFQNQHTTNSTQPNLNTIELFPSPPYRDI